MIGERRLRAVKTTTGLFKGKLMGRKNRITLDAMLMLCCFKMFYVKTQNGLRNALFGPFSLFHHFQEQLQFNVT